MERIIISSGYFNPIHKGHIEYLKNAKNLGGHHIVIVNNDKQVFLKKGYKGIPFEDRLAVIKELSCVDEIFLSIDKNRTVTQSIRKIAEENKGKEIIFAKGGDRTSKEIPESSVCKEYNIKIIDGLGPKIQHSSRILENIHDSILKETK